MHVWNLIQVRDNIKWKQENAIINQIKSELTTNAKGKRERWEKIANNKIQVYNF